MTFQLPIKSLGTDRENSVLIGRQSNPIRIAGLHQSNMLTLAERMRADANCIQQLLKGRIVRRREDGATFEVTGVLVGPTSLVSLYGHRTDFHRRARPVRIGLVEHLDLVEPKS